MNPLSHSLHVFYTILTTRYPYSKWAVFSSYLRLQWRSVVYHKVTSKRRDTIPVTFTESVMGYKVLFTSYSQLINLFEEIFVFQIYRFKGNGPRPFIIDCGSHLGLSLLYFKKLYPRGTALGFEPQAKMFSLLQYNVASNLKGSVRVFNAALANHKGTSAFYVDDAAGTLNAGLRNGRGKKVAGEVVTLRLSSFIDRPVDLLKIDVEGYEVEILRDLLSSGKIGLVREIVMEYHPELAGTALEALTGELTTAGFICHPRRDSLHPGATEWMVYCKLHQAAI